MELRRLGLALSDASLAGRVPAAIEKLLLRLWSAEEVAPGLEWMGDGFGGGCIGLGMAWSCLRRW